MEFVTSNVTVDGKAVEVKELSAKQRQALFALHKSETDPILVQANIIKMGCPKYYETGIEDIMEWPGGPFDAISKEIMNISGLGEDSEDDAEKN